MVDLLISDVTFEDANAGRTLPGRIRAARASGGEMTTNDHPAAPPPAELVDPDAADEHLERLRLVDALLRAAAAFDHQHPSCGGRLPASARDVG
jgi:hypothetical protein